MTNDLGAFLASRRARVSPSEVGFGTSTSGRRVAGLRREEVAALAGVSVDYYTRLEQGRERNPSPQVLDALSRALLMDADTGAHLFRVAGVAPTVARDGLAAGVHPDLLALVDGFSGSAAYVLGPSFDLLATNAVASALLAPFAPERNMARILFTHPRAREIYPEWSKMAAATVHALRLNSSLFPADRGIALLVSELSGSSAEFRTLWDDQSVGALTRASKVFHHPEVGRVELSYQSFEVTDAPGQQLLVGSPEPGTPSELAVQRLQRG